MRRIYYEPKVLHGTVIVSYLSYLPRYFSNAELLVNSNYNFKKQLVEYEKAFEYLKMRKT